MAAATLGRKERAKAGDLWTDHRCRGHNVPFQGVAYRVHRRKESDGKAYKN